jgi:hypothetical protein
LRGSFAHYARGNALRRAAVGYDRPESHAPGAQPRAVCQREFFAARRCWRCGGSDFHRRPAALGLDAIEQILASHCGWRARANCRTLTFALELGVRDVPGHPALYPQRLRA